MRTFIHRLFLVLAVALAAVHTAVGRAEARGATDVVLCADGGLVTVSLDARGQPVAKRHGCPDCVMGGLALDTAPPALCPPQPFVVMRLLPNPAGLPPGRAALAPSARGPPSVV